MSSWTYRLPPSGFSEGREAHGTLEDWFLKHILRSGSEQGKERTVVDMKTHCPGALPKKEPAVSCRECGQRSAPLLCSFTVWLTCVAQDPAFPGAASEWPSVMVTPPLLLVLGIPPKLSHPFINSPLKKSSLYYPNVRLHSDCTMTNRTGAPTGTPINRQFGDGRHILRFFLI